MPTAVLSRARVAELLPREWTDASWDDLLFGSKAEVEATDGDALTLSVTPDRLDLLSEGGLGLALQGMVGAAVGLPRPARPDPSDPIPVIRADASVVPIRPEIAGVILRAPRDRALDDGLLAEAIRFQELIHATIGRDRRAASLGIYPLDRAAVPIRYALEPVADVRFVPLDGTDEVTAVRFFAEHPLAAKYGEYGRIGDRCLVLRDAADTVLSLPPVLNSRTAGEARVGDRTLLLESTGSRPRSVAESLGLLMLPFVARGWSAGPVVVEGPGTARHDGRSILEPHTVEVPAALVRSVAGTALSAAEVAHRLAKSRLGAHPGGDGWTVAAPPWRPDLTTAVDAVEDVVLIAGVQTSDGIVPPSRTRGQRLPQVRLRRRLAQLLLGLGFAQPNTPLLLSTATVGLVGGDVPIPLTNPVSAEFAYVRDRLLPSHLDLLARNTRRGYPQRFAEVGPVVVRDPAAESGGATRYHAIATIATESAGFADATGVVEYLLRGLDVGSVREPAELAAAIPGRAARVRVAGGIVAEVGEIHPRILTALGVPVPAAWAEVDVSALEPLLGGRDTA